MHTHGELHDRPVLFARLLFIHVLKMVAGPGSSIANCGGLSTEKQDSGMKDERTGRNVTVSFAGPISHCRPKMTVK